MTFHLEVPLSETRVIKHFSPFQQPDVNCFKTIISTSLTKKYLCTKLVLLRDSDNVPSSFLASRQKKMLGLSPSLCNSPSPLHLHQESGQDLVSVENFLKQAFSFNLILRARQRGQHSLNSLQASVLFSEKTLEDQGTIFCSVPGTPENSLQWKRPTGSCRCSQQHLSAAAASQTVPSGSCVTVASMDVSH